MTQDEYRVGSISMVKNEQDIIEPFIRHHANLFNWMVVLDNRSVDDTRDIALKCARELKNVVLADDEDFGYFQAERMTRMLHYCQSAFFADFVLLLDADEFVAAADRISLIRALEAIPHGGTGLLPWRTYILHPEADWTKNPDPPKSMVWRRVKEDPLFRKVVFRFDRLYCPFFHVAQGNHLATTSSGRPFSSNDLDLSLLHFPVRSAHQYAAKSIVGWMAYLAKNASARAEGAGFQWAQGFDRIAGTRGLEPIEVCEASLHYAQTRGVLDWKTGVLEDSYPFTYRRRYSTGRYGEILSVVARSWEQSLTPPKEFSWEPRVPSSAEAESQAPIGTSFASAWHWDNLFVDVAPFRFLAEKFRPTEVLDVGCGVGAYLDIFKRFGGSSIFGIDGIPQNATVLSNEEYRMSNLAEAFELNRVFQMVINVEVLEHMEEAASLITMKSIAKHAVDCIVFSAAQPGQPGNGHVNCRPLSVWLERWAQLGWIPDLTESLTLRCLATMSWFRRNLVLLRRGTYNQGSTSIATLAEISRKPFQWYAQSPGVRSYPFQERLPEPPDGYPSC